jgi:hypothetical protein
LPRACHATAKLSGLELKSQQEQLLGYLPLALELPDFLMKFSRRRLIVKLFRVKWKCIIRKQNDGRDGRNGRNGRGDVSGRDGRRGRNGIVCLHLEDDF